MNIRTIYILIIIVFISGVTKAQEEQTSLKEIEKALGEYERDVGAYPTTKQGLGALIRRPITVNPERWKGSYLKKPLLDSWGEEYVYGFPGSGKRDFDLFSKGPDRIPNTPDDITPEGSKKSAFTEDTPSSPTIHPGLDPAKDYKETAGELDYEMVWIEPGSFIYGSRVGAYGPPVVKLDGYWIGRYEITTRQYCIFLNAVEDPEGLGYILIYEGSTYTIEEGRYVPRAGCENKPAYPVSWMGAAAFCSMLTEGTGKIYVLPTEAQWERAARGGLKMKKFPWGDEDPGGRANFGKKGETEYELLEDVGSYDPNAFGLFDMAGNVMEWCDDWYETGELKNFTNPLGPGFGKEKVLKGGNVFSIAHYLKVGLRFHNPPWFKSAGFRLAREPAPE